MNKPLILLLAAFCLSHIARSQPKELFIRKLDNSFYIEHKVVAKETFFSLGRLYNVHPHHIAIYNKVDLNKGLFIDQKIRIPLSDTNFTQKGNKGTPVLYKVGDKDDWISIANTYHVPADRLIAWNGNQISKGQKVIVGLLISNEMPAMTVTAPGDNNPLAKEQIKEEKKALKEEKEGLAISEKDTKKEEIKSIPPPPEKSIVSAVDRKSILPVNGKEGFFREAFELQIKKYPVKNQITVTSGIFKTTNGWEDAKYYLLIDGVAPGTIVKIINPSNNRHVYAKVLGQMSGIRQNEGLDLRISNSAAAAMEITETDKFILTVNY